MRLELRSSGGDTCPECGATALLFTPTSNENLERELTALFADEPPRWRFLRRRARQQVVDRVERACAEMRAATIRL